MKIAILTYVEQEGGTEYDVVVGQVAEALRAGGHEPSIAGVHADLGRLTELARAKPDLVFNLLETFAENDSADVGIAGFLELAGLPYTGSGPGELFLSGDKGLAKKVLTFEGVACPNFAVFSRDAGLETGGNLRLPLFVKPLRADASIGIGADSLVRDSGAMMKRVTAIHEEVGDDALAEEYIEGREFYVGVLGNREPEALPPIEMDFSGLPEGMPRVLDAKAKWQEGTPEYKGTKSILADLPSELDARLRKVAIDAYRALRLRDYGRIDLRLAETGEIYVLEANANCYLESNSEFATAAAAHGLDFPTLVQRIVDLAQERRENGKR
jgi:D-alanine-D-alanine ligase